MKVNEIDKLRCWADEHNIDWRDHSFYIRDDGGITIITNKCYYVCAPKSNRIYVDIIPKNQNGMTARQVIDFICSPGGNINE